MIPGGRLWRLDIDNHLQTRLDLHAAGRKIGICGQAPSDYPEFAQFLVRGKGSPSREGAGTRADCTVRSVTGDDVALDHAVVE